MAFKTQRKKAGKGLQETADHIGMTKQAVNSWERGATEPRFSVVRKLADFYGCTVEELLAPDEDESGKEG